MRKALFSSIAIMGILSLWSFGAAAQDKSASSVAPTPLGATYNLYKESDRSRVITTMTIFNQKGSFFLIQGDKWGGSGNVNGTEGYYDWKFTDGKSGRTTFTVQSDGSLRGHVLGSGIDWVYVAIPETKPVSLVLPKSCKVCFDEEKQANDGCTGTSLEKLDCLARNKKIRETCQETCQQP